MFGICFASVAAKSTAARPIVEQFGHDACALGRRPIGGLKALLREETDRTGLPGQAEPLSSWETRAGL